MKLRLRILTIALALLCFGLDGRAQVARFTPRAIELFECLPVQDGGRIKPVSTFADFTLLRISGLKSLRRADGTSASSSAWLLDVLFNPQVADDERVFMVAYDAALDAIGVTHVDRKKRDRYSFRELQPGIQSLFDKANEYAHIDAKVRNTVQTQIVDLAEAVDMYGSLRGRMDLALVPPERAAAQDTAWLTPDELALRAGAPMLKPSEEERALQLAFATLREKSGDPGAFEQQLSQLSGRLIARADARGEYAKVPLERFYYRTQFLFWGQITFVLAFLVTAVAWLLPRAKLPYRAGALLACAGTLLVIAAIVVRCMIRGRPPVSTLYETVIFITAVSTLVALVSERISRQRLGLSAAAVLGMIGLFIANRYESLDKKDTMPSLQAVLDTNFWLATHVTAVTIGYAAGMLAAMLASFYLLAKCFGFRRDERSFYSGLGRMVYGVLCFGVIFSTVGTILGGIWANDSWGRFWGWDPKENGALLIVLTQLVILHARMGGYLKEHGVCAAAALGGTVVAFSWFGVNLLGVGLHSYGFTSGIQSALTTYYVVQWGIVGLGTIGYWRGRPPSGGRGHEVRSEMPSHAPASKPGKVAELATPIYRARSSPRPSGAE